MRKIIQRTRRFEKAYLRLQKDVRELFIKKLGIFLQHEFHPSLDTHRLKGKRRNDWSFSVTADVRAIYCKYLEENKSVVVFTFIDIGGHNRVY